jgi:2-polyprenyl-3-methyl-5-hydroxy-6-metoxy-1,4-benzoquinol methylase
VGGNDIKRLIYTKETMGLKLPRRKKRNLKLSLAYRLVRWTPLSPRRKLKLLLDLSWIFSRLAHEQTFKTDVRPAQEEEEEDILLSGIPPNASVLDIGCGKGYVIETMLTKTVNITGIDFDGNSLEEAKKRAGNSSVSWICDDVFNYLNANADIRFDCIILSHVLEHIEEPGGFLKGLTDRAMHFYVEVPDFESNHLNLFRKSIGTDLVYTDSDHVSEFDRKELEAMFQECGLRIVRSEFRFGVLKYWCESTLSDT